jgi:hypothetical protein
VIFAFLLSIGVAPLVGGAASLTIAGVGQVAGAAVPVPEFTHATQDERIDPARRGTHHPSRSHRSWR